MINYTTPHGVLLVYYLRTGRHVYLRNLFLSPAWVMATMVFVTDVPMLVPIITGIAVDTLKTTGVEESSDITSSSGYTSDMQLLPVAVWWSGQQMFTHFVTKPCWPLWKMMCWSSALVRSQALRSPGLPRGWRAPNCPEKCPPLPSLLVDVQQNNVLYT